MKPNHNKTRKNNLIIMGMKHSGKTTVGKKTARVLSARFYDLDDFIVSIYNRDNPASHARSCRYIYQRDGKKVFLTFEVKAASEARGRMTENKVTVLALGGGTIENGPAMALLSGHGEMVYLREDPEILFNRIVSGGIPPFLSKKAPFESFLVLYERRSLLYRSAADIIIECGGRRVEAIVEDLVKR